jgi:hypothetical protein
MPLEVWDLWLPILLAGLAVHIASTIAWTALPHHKPEWLPLPEEVKSLQALKALGLKPGQYVSPHQGTTDESKKIGVQGMFIFWEKVPSMGQNIVLTLLYFLFISFTLGYLASIALPVGAEFKQVFRFVGTAGFLAYCGAINPHAIWFRRKVAMEYLDGVVFALVAAAVFAYFWPK